MEFDEVELCGVQVSFMYLPTCLFFVIYVFFFPTHGIYITPSWGSGSVKEHGNLGKGGWIPNSPIRLSGYYRFFRGYAVDEWDGEPGYPVGSD